MSPGGKGGRKPREQNNQDPPDLPKMKGGKSKESERYSFHHPSDWVTLTKSARTLTLFLIGLRYKDTY